MLTTRWRRSGWGGRIEGFDIGWFEEPVPPEDLDGHLAVKAALSIPIATGECEFTRIGFRGLLERRVTDYVQPDLCAAGGLSECKKIADMALAYGVQVCAACLGDRVRGCGGGAVAGGGGGLDSRRRCSRWNRCWSSIGRSIRCGVLCWLCRWRQVDGVCDGADRAGLGIEAEPGCADARFRADVVGGEAGPSVREKVTPTG